MEQPSESFESRAKEVSQVGGLAALGIVLLTASSANAAVQAIVLAVLGGPPALDAEGLGTIVETFLITAPFAIAVAIVAFSYLRVDFTPENQPYKGLIFVVVAIGIGLVVGSWVYDVIYSATLQVNVPSLTEAMAKATGPAYVKLGAAISWFVVGYYEFFGFEYFAAAIVAAGFGAYAAHRLLPPGKVARI
jgi:hypothetical protein